MIRPTNEEFESYLKQTAAYEKKTLTIRKIKTTTKLEIIAIIQVNAEVQNMVYVI